MVRRTKGVEFLLPEGLGGWGEAGQRRKRQGPQGFACRDTAGWGGCGQSWQQEDKDVRLEMGDSGEEKEGQLFVGLRAQDRLCH